jgi:sugar O-acyltransferase (sialic acid O-acetyltransferase NeuD family)
MTTRIAIFGSSGHARSVIDVVERQGRYKIVGLIDSFADIGHNTLGYRVLGGEDDLGSIMREHDISALSIAIGDNYQRGELVARLKRAHGSIRFVTAIHPAASVANSVQIGTGTVVMAGATVGASSQVGEFCIINSNSSIDHDCKMMDYSSIAPGAATGGSCTLGEYSAIGIGVSINQKLSIGQHTVVGSGATVVRSVADFKVAYGTPAVEIRERRQGEPYL